MISLVLIIYNDSNEKNQKMQDKNNQNLKIQPQHKIKCPSKRPKPPEGVDLVRNPVLTPFNMFAV